MSQISVSLTGPGDSPPLAAVPDEEAAEQELARLTAPLAAVRSEVGSVAVLAVAVVMTGAGAGLRLAAAAGFQVASVLALWAVEAVCDAGSARAEGSGAALEALEALAWVSATAAAHHREIPVWQRCTRCALAWLAGPSHPPLVLRRALIRAIPGNGR